MLSRRDAEEKIAEAINKAHRKRPMSFEQKEFFARNMIYYFETLSKALMKSPKIKLAALDQKILEQTQGIFGKDWWKE